MTTDKKTIAQKFIEAIGMDAWLKLKKDFQGEPMPTPTPAPSPEPTPAAMMEATLQDGTKIVYENLAEGAKVMVVTEQGEVAAPDGELVLVDGTKITTMGGIISAIEQAAPAPSEEITAMGEKVNELYSKIEAFTTQIADQNKALEEAKAENKELKANFGHMMKFLEIMLEEKETPAPKTDGEPQPQNFGGTPKGNAKMKAAAMAAQYTDPINTPKK